MKNILVICLLGLGSTAGLSSTQTIETTSMFGYGVEKQSSTGFKFDGGSLFICDIMKPSQSSLSFGVRTNFSGATGESKSLYRYSLGPVAYFKFNNEYSMHSSLSYFKEESVNDEFKTLYNSNGQEIVIGLLRTHTLSKNAQWTLGSHMAYHSGGIQLESANLNRHYAPTSNIGLSQGITVGLKVRM